MTFAGIAKPACREMGIKMARNTDPAERATRIELASTAWEAVVLPMNYARGIKFDRRSSRIADEAVKLKSSEQDISDAPVSHIFGQLNRFGCGIVEFVPGVEILARSRQPQ